MLQKLRGRSPCLPGLLPKSAEKSIPAAADQVYKSPWVRNSETGQLHGHQSETQNNGQETQNDAEPQSLRIFYVFLMK